MASTRPPFILWKYLTSELMRCCCSSRLRWLGWSVSRRRSIRWRGDVGLADAIKAHGPALCADVAVCRSRRGSPPRSSTIASRPTTGHGLPGQRDSAASDSDALRVHGARSGGTIGAVLANSVMPRLYKAAGRSSRGMSGRLIIGPIRRLAYPTRRVGSVRRPDLPPGSA